MLLYLLSRSSKNFLKSVRSFGTHICRLFVVGKAGLVVPSLRCVRRATRLRHIRTAHIEWCACTRAQANDPRRTIHAVRCNARCGKMRRSPEPKHSRFVRLLRLNRADDYLPTDSPGDECDALEGPTFQANLSEALQLPSGSRSDSLRISLHRSAI